MIRLGIGGVVFAIDFQTNGIDLVSCGAFKGFITEQEPEILLKVFIGDLPILLSCQQVFDSGGIWSLDSCADKWVIRFHSPSFTPNLFQLVIFNHDFSAGEFHMRADLFDKSNFSLENIISQSLMVNLLAARQLGVLLHACAVNDNGTGRLFVGVSGAGKSTTAGLWAEQNGATILCDDRVIIREINSCYYAYGTPWHGDFDAVSFQAVPLEKIFVIHHAQENQATLLPSMQAASSLLVRSFPTFWNPTGMAFTLEFLDRLCQTIPCYDLGFVPEPETVDYVRCLK